MEMQTGTISPLELFLFYYWLGLKNSKNEQKIMTRSERVSIKFYSLTNIFCLKNSTR